VIDQPLATRAAAPLRLRTLTPNHAHAFARHAAADLEHLPWAEAASEAPGAAGWLDAYQLGSDAVLTRPA
jgi:hypothetical protein